MPKVLIVAGPAVGQSHEVREDQRTISVRDPWKMSGADLTVYRIHTFALRHRTKSTYSTRLVAMPVGDDRDHLTVAFEFLFDLAHKS